MGNFCIFQPDKVLEWIENPTTYEYFSAGWQHRLTLGWGGVLTYDRWTGDRFYTQFTKRVTAENVERFCRSVDENALSPIELLLLDTPELPSDKRVDTSLEGESR